MKLDGFGQGQSQKPFGVSQPDAGSRQRVVDFTPSPDEVARRAYFSYVNEGAPQGRAVQHWLEAEAQLIEERNRTRVHAFHNQT